MNPSGAVFSVVFHPRPAPRIPAPHNICLRGGIIKLAAFMRLSSILFPLDLKLIFEFRKVKENKNHGLYPSHLRILVS